ncbi:MAG: hypothetical protein K2X32_09155 [Phycisphaerales bacterium]|nr:hypothetical protein [Phycisphaerales bacterium]
MIRLATLGIALSGVLAGNTFADVFVERYQQNPFPPFELFWARDFISYQPVNGQPVNVTVRPFGSENFTVGNRYRVVSNSPLSEVIGQITVSPLFGATPIELSIGDSGGGQLAVGRGCFN